MASLFHFCLPPLSSIVIKIDLIQFHFEFGNAMEKRSFLSLLCLLLAVHCTAFIHRDAIIPACTVGAACLAASCVKILSTGDECLVERLGQFNRKLGPGLHFIFHPFESISFYETIREQVLDVPPQECFSLDNAPITADAIVYLKIVNMHDACYKVFNVKNAVKNLCLTRVREEIGSITLEEAFSSRSALNKSLLHSLNDVCMDWGIQITRVEIQHLQPSQEILRALESQIAADRQKRASILQSEGEKSKLINEAEGRAAALVKDAEAKKTSLIMSSQAEAERQRLEAEGIKIAIETIARAIEKDNDPQTSAIKESVQFLKLKQYLETQGKFSESSSTKVLMFPSQENVPYNVHSLIQ